MSKLKLLKVIVQPVFVVIDDEGELTEQAAQPVTVSAADWPTFATTTFAQGFEELRQQVEGPAPEEQSKPATNRATRRHPPKP